MEKDSKSDSESELSVISDSEDENQPSLEVIEAVEEKEAPKKVILWNQTVVEKSKNPRKEPK